MSLITNLGTFLKDTGHGTLGTTLFINEAPADTADVIIISELPSPAPSSYLNTKSLDFEVWCRNKSTKTGKDKLENIETLLHRYHHLDLGDYHIYFIGALGDIEYLDKDIEGRSLHKQNYRAIYIDKRTVS